jgi:hypothetical protein
MLVVYTLLTTLAAEHQVLFIRLWLLILDRFKRVRGRIAICLRPLQVMVLLDFIDDELGLDFSLLVLAVLFAYKAWIRNLTLLTVEHSFFVYGYPPDLGVTKFDWTCFVLKLSENDPSHFVGETALSVNW